MPRIVASIEARMGSSRLPNKVLMDIHGKPALTRLLERLRRAKFLDDIVLATTTEKQDDILETWAKSQDVSCFRGSEDDVLKRVVQAHQKMDSEIIVEITGDCPLIDPEIVDLGIETFLQNDCDVLSNCRKSSFPMGIDVQVFYLADLIEVEKKIHDLAVREHVSLYFYENPDKYKIYHLCAPTRWQAPNYRFQLDYKEDYDFISTLYQKLTPKYGDFFGIEEIMLLLQNEPQLIKMNIDCVEKSAR